MSRLMLSVFAAAILLVTGPAMALDDAAYGKMNRTAIEQHILPRYDALASATTKLAEQAKAFCAAPSSAGLGPLRDAYNGAVDAWQGIQHVTFGPVDLFFRSQRIAFWPDARNSIGKQMTELLAKQDADALSPDRLGKSSVAVQGLPALERLIFGKDADKLLSGNDAAFRCKYVQAITVNLATMAAETGKDWREGSPSFETKMLEPAKSDGLYHEPKDATLDLFKSLYTAIELIADHKLARPLGGSIDQARPHLAEAWRSQRSMRNIVINLKAAQDLYGKVFSPVVPDRDLDDAIVDTFRRALEAAQGISEPLEQAVEDKAQRGKVEALATQILALKTLLLQKLPGNIELQVGFNALDGD